ncbi:DUF982 domain-containing protein [Rhizobium sp. LjRoot254]|uniref:DUF982 domain-containing protein n=1 Tax=Rhizobium sp. LjRoot254 TaxID=3342297 RepID=UPI003ED16DF9
MEDWDKIIVLQLKDPKQQTLPVRDVKDAARILLGKWPRKQGTGYRQAVLSCSAALKGSASQETAQSSFMAAAMEAAIPFEVKDRFETEIAAVCDAIFQEESTAFALAAPLSDLDGPTLPFWQKPLPTSGRLAR